MSTPKEKLTGEPIVYLVGKRKIFTIPDEINNECIFILKSVSLVSYDGSNPHCALWPDKEFVPSFDKEKSITTLINSWASRTPADDAKTKIVAEINIETREIKVNGSGFEFVVIHMYRLNESE